MKEGTPTTTTAKAEDANGGGGSKSSWWDRFVTNVKLSVGHGLLRTILVFQRKTSFKIDYGFGYNFHFETTEEDLAHYLPKHFRPLPMVTLESGAADDSTPPKYLVSIYSAGNKLDVESKRNRSIPRSDVFTYVYDDNGLPAMYFLRALTPVDPFKDNPDRITEGVVKFIMWFCAMDPKDHSLGYDHLEVDELSIDEATGIAIKHKDACIALTKSASDLDYQHLFSRLFVAANSQIYRGHHMTRNVNFFNQDFLQVPVARIPVQDLDELSSVDLSSLHPLCTKLVNVEAYKGVGGRPITWYFEFD